MCPYMGGGDPAESPTASMPAPKQVQRDAVVPAYQDKGYSPNGLSQ